MEAFGILWILAIIAFIILGILTLLTLVVMLFSLRELHKEIAHGNRQRSEESKVILDALNAIVDASETTASTVIDAANEDAEEGH